MIPRPVFATRKDAMLARHDAAPDPAVLDRLSYYNGMAPSEVSAKACDLAHLPRKPSYYHYDLTRYTRAFPAFLKADVLFGDVITVQPVPTLVKSRPIAPDNGNSILLKLDRLRHFTWERDSIGFRDKRRAAVWRGGLINEQRRDLVQRFYRHPVFDIGHVGAPQPGLDPKRFLSVAEQMRFRYVISVEGNDVATNLKWILASNALCMMPRPRYETWFMEGRLESGVHYVELRPDFADLEEKVAHYDRNEDEALAIIARANAHVRQFLDPRREDLLSLLVLQRYFALTGQLPAGALPERGRFGYSAASARPGS
ncbi:glycosyltransferase family 90 protein [Prosthecomicrobium pneumaticum]|nr:glycosyltransferase family 90 protein [Prosthecomicrobium pneumaticum]